MSWNSIDDARRAARRAIRLGREPVCAACGERTPEGLVRAHRSILQAHHLVALAVDTKTTILLCGTCHLIVTALQHDAGVTFRVPQSPLERARAILRSHAALHSLLAKACLRYAKECGAADEPPTAPETS
jgi:hypothetical protein